LSTAYSDSNLCLVAFMAKLNKRLQDNIKMKRCLFDKLCFNAPSMVRKLKRPPAILAFSANPGSHVNTNLWNHCALLKVLVFVLRPFSKSKDRAAATVCFAATAKDLKGHGGSYIQVWNHSLL
jgi:hypothetical protein